MRASDLHYDLDDSCIARYPAAERDGSRMLVLERPTGQLRHAAFRDLPGYLDPGDLLVRNISRVLPARLLARRASGGRVELLLFRAGESSGWMALARPAGRLRDGERLRLPSGHEVTVRRRSTGDEPMNDALWLEGDDLENEMSAHGSVPLPPYLRRPPEEIDRSAYQTLWASEPGSAAVPTAGLHFTPRVLADLRQRGVRIADLTLHVGPGTFLPVRTESLDDHPMHAETYDLPAATIAAITETRANGHRVLAVGTTTVRALESAWQDGGLRAGSATTRLLIQPGFEFHVVDALLTNFHQPRSTLLALVAAFAGMPALRAAYAEALERGYRFLSYGDVMLVV